MSSVSPFSAAAAPDVFVPGRFGDVVLGQIHHYDEARSDIDEMLSALTDLMDEKDTADKADFQGLLSDAYACFMAAATKGVLTLAFFMKNVAHMPTVLRRIDGRVQKELGDYKTMTLADPDHLEYEMLILRENVFEASEIAAEYLERRARRFLEMEHVDTTFLSLSRHNLRVFNDWVEMAFFDEYGLPLNNYPRSKPVEAELNARLHSKPYCENLIQKIRGRLLQEEFPGLSLDGDKLKPAQLKSVYEQLPGHVTAFTSSKKAHVIHPDPAGPQGPRAGQGRAIRHSKTGCTPR